MQLKVSISQRKFFISASSLDSCIRCQFVHSVRRFLRQKFVTLLRNLKLVLLVFLLSQGRKREAFGENINRFFQFKLGRVMFTLSGARLNITSQPTPSPVLLTTQFAPLAFYVSCGRKFSILKNSSLYFLSSSLGSSFSLRRNIKMCC